MAYVGELINDPDPFASAQDEEIKPQRRIGDLIYDDNPFATTARPETPAPSSTVGGAIRALGRGAAESVTTELPGMVGGAIQFVGEQAGRVLPEAITKPVAETGKAIKDWSEEKAKEWYGETPEMGTLEKIIYEGTKMLAPSVIPGGVAASGVRMLKGLGGVVKLAKAAAAAGDVAKATELMKTADVIAKSANNIASGFAGGVFGLNQAQQTVDTANQRADALEAQGKTAEAAAMRERAQGAAPYLTGAIEAMGEYFGTKYLGKLLGVSEAEVGKKMAEEGGWAFAKDLLKTLGVEIGTEMGQQYGEAGVEKVMGIRPEAHPFDEALDVIGPTAFMTLLTGGLAAGAGKIRGKGVKEAREGRDTTQTTEEEGQALYDRMMRGIQSGDLPVDQVRAMRDASDQDDQILQKTLARVIREATAKPKDAPHDLLKGVAKEEPKAPEGPPIELTDLAEAPNIPVAGIPPLAMKSAEESAGAMEQAFGEEERLRQSPRGRAGLLEQVREEGKPKRTAFDELVSVLSGKLGRLREENPQVPSAKEIEDEEFAAWARKAANRTISDEEALEAKRAIEKMDEDEAFRQWQIKSQKSYAEEGGVPSDRETEGRIPRIQREEGLPWEEEAPGGTVPEPGRGEEEAGAGGILQGPEEVADLVNQLLPGHALKFDSPKTEAGWQFTPQEGPAKGASFTVTALDPQVIAATVRHMASEWQTATANKLAYAELRKAAQEAATSPLNDKTPPTEGQKRAGNYPLGHAEVHGLKMSFEHDVGTEREGTSPEGKKWKSTLKDLYGYLRGPGTEGKDGRLDVFIGDHPLSEKVYVIRQVDPKTSRFDEHKIMMGYRSKDEAREAYLRNYEKGWQGLGGIQELHIEDFKARVKRGDYRFKEGKKATETMVDRAKEELKKRAEEAKAALEAKKAELAGEKEPAKPPEAAGKGGWRTAPDAAASIADTDDSTVLEVFGHGKNRALLLDDLTGETERYFIERRDGTFVYNPKTKDQYFESVEEAKAEFAKSPPPSPEIAGKAREAPFEETPDATKEAFERAETGVLFKAEVFRGQNTPRYSTGEWWAEGHEMASWYGDPVEGTTHIRKIIKQEVSLKNPYVANTRGDVIEELGGNKGALHEEGFLTADREVAKLVRAAGHDGLILLQDDSFAGPARVVVVYDEPQGGNKFSQDTTKEAKAEEGEKPQTKEEMLAAISDFFKGDVKKPKGKEEGETVSWDIKKEFEEQNKKTFEGYSFVGKLIKREELPGDWIRLTYEKKAEEKPAPETPPEREPKLKGSELSTLRRRLAVAKDRGAGVAGIEQAIREYEEDPLNYELPYKETLSALNIAIANKEKADKAAADKMAARPTPVQKLQASLEGRGAGNIGDVGYRILERDDVTGSFYVEMTENGQRKQIGISATPPWTMEKAREMALDDAERIEAKPAPELKIIGPAFEIGDYVKPTKASGIGPKNAGKINHIRTDDEGVQWIKTTGTGNMHFRESDWERDEAPPSQPPAPVAETKAPEEKAPPPEPTPAPKEKVAPTAPLVSQADIVARLPEGKRLKDYTVKIPGVYEGKTMEIEENAQIALNEVDGKIETYRKLMECLNA